MEEYEWCQLCKLQICLSLVAPSWGITCGSETPPSPKQQAVLIHGSKQCQAIQDSSFGERPLGQWSKKRKRIDIHRVERSGSINCHTKERVPLKDWCLTIQFIQGRASTKLGQELCEKVEN